MATLTEAHNPPSFPVQPIDLPMYANILPSTINVPTPGQELGSDESDESDSTNDMEHTSDKISDDSDLDGLDEEYVSVLTVDFSTSDSDALIQCRMTHPTASLPTTLLPTIS
jgi:hypothetical protein